MKLKINPKSNLFVFLNKVIEIQSIVNELGNGNSGDENITLLQWCCRYVVGAEYFYLISLGKIDGQRVRLPPPPPNQTKAK